MGKVYASESVITEFWPMHCKIFHKEKKREKIIAQMLVFLSSSGIYNFSYTVHCNMMTVVVECFVYIA